MENEKSLLMQDSWRSNYGYEAMLDFQMSWLMRLAAEPDIKKKKLHKISKEVLLRLIGLLDTPNVVIRNVEVWRQWERIDVTAEVEVVVDGVSQHHLVVIEDKAYTMIHDDQLNRYAETVSAHYSGRRKKDYKIHYWVITFFDRSSNYWSILESACNNAKLGNVEWKLLSFYDVIGWSKDRKEEFEGTESDLFEEFWLKEWC